MRTRPASDLEAAVEHARWVAARQPDGLFLLRAFINDGPKRLKQIAVLYCDNRDPDFELKLRRFLQRCVQRGWHVFYGVNSFDREEAKAANVLRSRMAQVDADGVAFPIPGPCPTRIISTSPRNYQLLYELDRELPRAEVETISKYFTHLTGGDSGGHSAAKLLRMPGTLNLKPEYKPSPLVRVIENSGQVHRASALLRRASAFAIPTHDAKIAADLERQARDLSPKVVREKYWKKLPSFVRLRLRQSRVYGHFTIRINGKKLLGEPDDRSAIIWKIGCAFRDAGATPAETLAAIMDSVFWRDREADGKREDPIRLISKIFANVTPPVATISKRGGRPDSSTPKSRASSRKKWARHDH